MLAGSMYVRYREEARDTARVKEEEEEEWGKKDQ